MKKERKDNKKGWEQIEYFMQITGVIMERVFGLPLCEGPTSMFGTMIIIGITMGFVLWLNYDQMGFLAAGARAVRSTQAPINKAIRTGVIAVGQSVVFMIAQILVLQLVCCEVQHAYLPKAQSGLARGAIADSAKASPLG